MEMKKSMFQGSGVALVTPFTPDNKPDFEKYEELINFHIAKKTDAIFVCATTGEAPTLNDTEHLELVKKAIDVAKGRIPIIAGTGSNDTAHAVMMTKEVEKMGADGVLLVTPYYNKTTQRGLEVHYKEIASSTDLPCCLYNVPSRTGVHIEIETLKKLYEEKNIVAIKEASGNMSYVSKIAAEIPEIDIYSGNDDIIVPLMSIGAKGVISVVANIIPNDIHDMCTHALSGDFKKASQMQLKMLKLVNSLFLEVNPIPVKEAMNLMGLNVGKCRLPLYDMDEKNLFKLKEAMKEYKLL